MPMKDKTTDKLILAVPKGRTGELAELSDRLGLRLTRIGQLHAGSGLRVFDAEGAEIALAKTGWTHF